MELIGLAQRVFEIEAKEIIRVSEKLDSQFENAIDSIFHCKGKIVISGIGKSGIVGRKISATLSSTGTPSFFLHPSEAYHGDLGMIEEEDIVILISNSGETDEILKLLPFLKDQGNIVISLCGKKDSNLSKNSNFFLNVGVEKEACPLQLAPTSSTTATLVMGDALAIALMERRSFKDENFAKFHPGGSLGRRLLLTVDNVMRSTDLPIVNEDDTIKEVVHSITKGKTGMVIVLNGHKKISGVITDGDVRRTMESREEDFFSLKAQDLMTKNPKKVLNTEKLILASKLMTTEKVNSLIVINEHESLVGIIQLFDIGF